MKTADIEVSLIDFMGDDISVVNAARVSFDAISDYEDSDQLTLSERDVKLIRYLANHKHWSPFSHCFASFRIKAPIFVARQLAKHQVGLAWNEVSRRYVNKEPEFFFPKAWRGKPVNAKQGSSDVIQLPDENDSYYIESTITAALNAYNYLLDCNVAPEQARMVLPQNTMTEWIWSGSLYAFNRVCKLRLEKTAQQETSEVARIIDDWLKNYFPKSWKALSEVP